MRALIFSLLVSLLLSCGCNSGRTPDAPATNHEASTAADLPGNPLAWNVITTQIDRRRGCMATLYGNDAALTHAMSAEDTPIPAESRFALVTWSQSTDPNWFGAKIPGKVKSVELVYMRQQPGEEGELTYDRYDDSSLEPATDVSSSQADQRKRYIASLKAAVMP